MRSGKEQEAWLWLGEAGYPIRTGAIENFLDGTAHNTTLGEINCC